jgi:uncharacterized protein YbjT (DUF2867 family)
MILITGAGGFVGGHLIERLRKEGIAVRALVRTLSKAQKLRDLGAEIAEGDIGDPASLDGAMQGCDSVIHLVGIIQEGRGFTFRSVHVEGTAKVLAAAKKGGAKRFLYQSALGTREHAQSEYHRTKWEAEQLVKASGIPWIILRPSLIYGPGDQFTLRLADAIRLSPVLPVIGPGTFRVQPVFIDDMTACLAKAVAEDAFLNRTLSVCGPEQLSYEEVTRAVADALGIRRPTVHLPLFFMRAMAMAAETVLSRPPITTEQLLMLQEDTVCEGSDVRDAFGIEAVKFGQGLEKFMRKTA